MVACARRAKGLKHCLVRNGPEGVREVKKSEGDVAFLAAGIFQEALHHIIIFIDPVVWSKSFWAGEKAPFSSAQELRRRLKRLVYNL